MKKSSKPNQNPPAIEEALKVPGARVTLPVSVAITKDVFTPEFIRGARANGGLTIQLCAGDDAAHARFAA